jgi:hypothetical protein
MASPWCGHNSCVKIDVGVFRHGIGPINRNRNH